MKLPFDIRKVYEWPLAFRMMVMGLVVGIIFFLANFFDFSSLNDELNNAKKQEDDLKQQFQSSYSSEAELEATLTQAMGIASLLKEWQQKLMQPKQLPELLNNILKAGMQSGLKFNLFNPSAEIKQFIYIKVPIKVIATGNFSQMSTFISLMTSMIKLVVISDLSIYREPVTKTPDAPVESNNVEKLVLEMTLEVYRLQDLAELMADKPKKDQKK